MNSILIYSTVINTSLINKESTEFETNTYIFCLLGEKYTFSEFPNINQKRYKS